MKSATVCLNLLLTSHLQLSGDVNRLLIVCCHHFSCQRSGFMNIGKWNEHKQSSNKVWSIHAVFISLHLLSRSWGSFKQVHLVELFLRFLLFGFQGVTASITAGGSGVDITNSRTVLSGSNLSIQQSSGTAREGQQTQRRRLWAPVPAQSVECTKVAVAQN